MINIKRAVPIIENMEIDPWAIPEVLEISESELEMEKTMELIENLYTNVLH